MLSTIFDAQNGPKCAIELRKYGTLRLKTAGYHIIVFTQCFHCHCSFSGVNQTCIIKDDACMLPYAGTKVCPRARKCIKIYGGIWKVPVVLSAAMTETLDVSSVPTPVIQYLFVTGIWWVFVSVPKTSFRPWRIIAAGGRLICPCHNSESGNAKEVGAEDSILGGFWFPIKGFGVSRVFVS